MDSDSSFKTVPHSLLLLVVASNDAFDASTGVDGGKPESVVNLTGNRNGVLLLANAFLVAGAALLWRLVSTAVRPSLAPCCPLPQGSWGL